MVRMVREFIDIREHTPLDEVIRTLEAVRDSEGVIDAELRMRGDHVFGRVMTISYLRPQTAEESACDERYLDAGAKEIFKVAA